MNNWKCIEPNNGAAVNPLTNIELGTNLLPQLYDLNMDLSEKNILSHQKTEITNEMVELLWHIKE